MVVSFTCPGCCERYLGDHLFPCPLLWLSPAPRPHFLLSSFLPYMEKAYKTGTARLPWISVPEERLRIAGGDTGQRLGRGVWGALLELHFSATAYV